MTVSSYSTLGLHLASSIALPELAPLAPEKQNQDADIRIEQGSIPETLPEASFRNPIHQTIGATQHLMSFPNIARMLISNGTHIVIDPLTGGDETDVLQDWRSILLGSGLTSLCFQRGWLAMHASAVLLPGRTTATLLLGHATAGKSTLAAALTQRGAHLISDDLSPLEQTREGFVVKPVGRGIKLHPTSFEGLSLSQDGALPVRKTEKTKLLYFPERSHPTACLLGDCLILEEARSTRPSGEDRYVGATAFAHLSNNVHRRRAASAMGLRGQIFAQTVALAEQVPVTALRLPKQFPALIAIADRLIAEARDP
ncbi:MAG: hypothetical protein ACPGOY_04805 [Rhodospirillaceae bacterium]